MLMFVHAAYAVGPAEKAKSLAGEYKGRGYINISSQKSGRLDDKSMCSFAATLYSGQSYIAVVGSEDYVKQIGIYIFDPDKNKMPADNKNNGNGSLISFTAKSTGRHIFMIKGVDKNVSFEFYLISKSG